MTRFHVHTVDANAQEWENELFAKCWSEMAHLMSQDASDTGSIIVLPSHPDGVRNEEEEENDLLSYLQSFVDDKLRRPIQWLGRQEDWEIVAFERGSGAIRMLYKLSDIPDLGERDSGNDEQIRL